MNANGCELQETSFTDSARCFTLEQAQGSLVLVRKIVADIVVGYGSLLDLQEMIEAKDTASCGELRDQLIKVVEKLQTCLEELERVGAELQDWALGVVEFPCLWNGREVRLCWQHGQAGISFWHERGETPAMRRPLATLTMEQLKPAELTRSGA